MERENAVRQVLGYFDLPGGYPPSGFMSKLIALYQGSDFINKSIIRRAWPTEGQAIHLVADDNSETDFKQARDWAGIT